MGIKITTLSENATAMDSLLGEWGLSILLETGDGNILFDTGQSVSAAYNADPLNIDLGCVDKIVLSHGHYDHTGGLWHVLRRMRKEVEVIAHPGVWGAKYANRGGQGYRFIGIPYRRQWLENLGATFTLTTEPVKVTDNVMTTGEVEMVTGFETVASVLCVREGGDYQLDPVLDDLALIIKTELGLAVVLGCAHRGIINTLYQARRLTGIDKIHTVLGGAHLVGESEERVWATIAALKELDVQRLGLCHCTGLAAASVIAQEFGERFFFNAAGTTIELP